MSYVTFTVLSYQKLHKKEGNEPEIRAPLTGNSRKVVISYPAMFQSLILKRIQSILLASVALPLLSPGLLNAATYRGVRLDGKRFDAEVYSYASSHYYDVQVRFSGDKVIIYFPRGGALALDLDDEEIDDLDNISAFDYKRAEHWDIDLD